MKLFRKAVALIIAATSTLVSANNEDFLNDLLLENAIPLEEYESRVIASGGEPFIQNLDRELANGNDDDNAGGYFSYDKLLTFNGYALKYATCQKVQRFSVEAIQSGEYSSMVTDNIVILRLCPKKSCDSSSQFGCSSGFGEYAIEVSDYMSIVMRYQQHKEANFCSFCQDCASENGYSVYDDDAYNTTGSSSSSSFYKSTSSGQLQIYDSNTCYAYSNMCQDVIDTCDSYYDDDDNYNATSYSTDFLSYLDYFGCAKINGYWVSPKCDTKQNTIQMGIYYDNTCNQDAGNDGVDVSSFLGDDFDTNIFSYATDVGCIDCQSSVSRLFISRRDLPISPFISLSLIELTHLTHLTPSKLFYHTFTIRNTRPTTTHIISFAVTCIMIVGSAIATYNMNSPISIAQTTTTVIRHHHKWTTAPNVPSSKASDTEPTIQTEIFTQA